VLPLLPPAPSPAPHLVLQQHGAPRLQLRLVHKGQDAHVILGAVGGGHNGVAGGRGEGRGGKRQREKINKELKRLQAQDK
jgi:NAD(P)H-dependent flavin oxidoreductase YrpB (nitropropane dioxygenase family)